MPETILHYEVKDHVAEIRLDRPPVNGLTVALVDGVIDALRRAAADDDVRCVVIASAVPKRFCAGLDLEVMTTDIGGEAARELVDKLYVRLSEAQQVLGKPSIAAVNGTARGGGVTLAISCDVILAGRDASFGYPEIDVGLLPAIHFLQLPRIVGRHRAFELLFSGRAFSADEAATLGLVSRVVDDVDAEARALARQFAAKSPTAMRIGRTAFMRVNELPRQSGLRDAVDDFSAIAMTSDAREGIAAFVGKRKPKWQEG
jgi:enoyl-CoA hydratase/carnithine racemase